MGYCYAKGGGLVCDVCGTSEPSANVRKRTCLYKVSGLPYCKPNAICDSCLARIGGPAKLHAACKAKAAESQAKDDAIKAGMAAGGLYVASAFGDWKEGVPAGMTGVLFRGSDSEAWRLVPEADYRPETWLADYPGAQAWPGRPDKELVTS